MTRKDYILLANAIKGMPSHALTLRTTRLSAARSIADALAGDNPRFKRDRFLTACGVLTSPENT